MDRQQEFVLRTIEERDIRFVRLWFTDVLGILKSVAIAPAELEGAFAEGIGFDGSAIEGFARVYESDMLAKPDPSTFQVLPWRGDDARHRPDVLRHPPARRLARRRRPSARAASAQLAKAADLGFTFYTHPEIEFFLLKTGRPTGEARCRSTTAATSTTCPHAGRPGLPPAAITMLETMGISVEFSHHEGAPGQQEIDLRYADALSTADNIMTFRPVVKEVALEQGVCASFMPKPFAEHPGSGMHTHLSPVRGRRQRLPRARRRPTSCRSWPVSSSPGCCSTRPRSPRSPTSGSTPTSGCAAGERPRPRLLGPQQPLGAGARADVQAGQGPVHAASRCAAWTRRATRTWPSPCCSRRGSRASRRSTNCPPDRGRRLGADRRRAPGDGHRAAAAQPRARRSRVMESCELVAETLGEHVFDFFLRNKRAEWARLPQPGDAVRAASATCRACDRPRGRVPRDLAQPGQPVAIAGIGFSDRRRARAGSTTPALADLIHRPWTDVELEAAASALSSAPTPTAPCSGWCVAGAVGRDDA